MRKIAAILISVIMVCSMGGCSTEEKQETKTVQEEKGSGEKIKIGVSIESLVAGMVVKSEETMVKTIEEMGGEVVEVIAEGDATKQNQQISNLIAQGVDAILCFAKDGSAIATAVEEAQNAGIPFILVNRAIQSESVIPAAQVLANNEEMAYELLKWWGERAREKGEKYRMIELIGDLTDEGAVNRKIGFERAVEEYSDVLSICAEVPTEWDLDKALNGLLNAIKANEDANLIITPSDFLWPSIKSALEQTDNWGKIGEENHFPVISFDGDEVGMQYLKDGYSWANAAQNPVFEAQEAVKAAFSMAEGEEWLNSVIDDEGIIVTIDNIQEVGPSVWSWDMLK